MKTIEEIMELAANFEYTCVRYGMLEDDESLNDMEQTRAHLKSAIDELRAALKERECAYMEGFEAAKHEARDVIEEQRRIIETLNSGIGCETTLDSLRVLEERDELRAKLAELESQQPIGFLCHGHFYKWPSEDDYCGNVEDHILLYAAQVKDIKSGPVYNANCIRHPAAPHGVDVEASWRAGHSVCVCQSWAPGGAS